MFVAPTLLAILVVAFYPLFETFRLSFTNMEKGFPDYDYVGMRNYTELLSQKEFWIAARNTILFTIVSVGLEMIIGLLFALLVQSQFKGRGLVRAAMLIPWAIPTVIAAQMWGWIYNDVYGVLNDLLYHKTGLLDKPVAWTAQPGLALFSVILVDVWKTTPFCALLLLAGLQQIPQQSYEASEVDGASKIQSFLYITLPLLKPAIAVTLIFRTLDALRVFDVIWVLTNGRVGTESLATFNYKQAIVFSRVGYGSSVSVMIFLLIALFVLAYVYLLREGRGGGSA